ncbi:MAG: lysophospholipid acyltransferase (LPLAT)-like uncharacterized protein [Bradymonadia bacterium]
MSGGRRLLGWGIAGLVQVWIATLRVRQIGSVEGPAVIAFWHGDQLALLRARPRGRLIAPISASRDGRLQARVMRRFRIEDAPGSSSRGGLAAARALLRALRAGAIALVAVDGPRGPAQVAKPGAAFLSRRAGVALRPVGVAARRAYRLRRAWDRFALPLPFTRVVVVFGPVLPADASARVLEQAIFDASARARAVVDGSGE